MKLKTVISAVSFFATLPCALLGLVGGEVVAQTLDCDFGTGQSSVNLVVCYKGKSLFAETIKICVETPNETFTFTPVVSSGWRPQISLVTMRDGNTCLLFTVGDKSSSSTHFLLYQISNGAQLLEQWNFFD